MGHNDIEQIQDLNETPIPLWRIPAEIVGDHVHTRDMRRDRRLPIPGQGVQHDVCTPTSPKNWRHDMLWKSSTAQDIWIEHNCDPCYRTAARTGQPCPILMRALTSGRKPVEWDRNPRASIISEPSGATHVRSRCPLSRKSNCTKMFRCSMTSCQSTRARKSTMPDFVPCSPRHKSCSPTHSDLVWSYRAERERQEIEWEGAHRRIRG